MKGRREDFYDAFVQRALETLQQPALLEIGQEGSQRLTRSRFLADAREPRQRGIPYLNNQVSVRCKNADFGLRINRQISLQLSDCLKSPFHSHPALAGCAASLIGATVSTVFSATPRKTVKTVRRSRETDTRLKPGENERDFEARL